MFVYFVLAAGTAVLIVLIVATVVTIRRDSRAQAIRNRLFAAQMTAGVATVVVLNQRALDTARVLPELTDGSGR